MTNGYSPALHRVRFLHRREMAPGGWRCKECATAFPCRTVRTMRFQDPEIEERFERYDQDRETPDEVR